MATNYYYYHIENPEGVDMGIWTGLSPVQALLKLHRDAGYGESVVWIERGELVFDTDETRRLCGGVDDWHITETDPGAVITVVIGDTTHTIKRTSRTVAEDVADYACGDAALARDLSEAVSVAVTLAPLSRFGAGTADERYEFDDGSTLVTAEGGYDVGFGLDDCWCWAGEGAHEDGCPHAA